MSSLWIFGYGSLMFKVNFPYVDSVVGHVKGYQRRFYQESTDHRGTPENPGRVVTLVSADSQDKVYGIAYKISKADEDDVFKYLDHRERGGYERVHKTFYPENSDIEPFKIVIYVAHTHNKQYAGETDDDAIAAQIVNAVGPSGPNSEYVRRLASTMRKVAPHVCDEHLFSIEEKVIKLDKLIAK